MVLSNQDVTSLIEKGVSDKISLAREKAKKVNMHITGKGVTDFLIKLDDYETNAQKLLREKLVKSNRSLFSFILRPTDKIFTAKGGAINYNLPQTEINYLREQVSELADGLNVKKYLKKVVKKQYVIDPNGVLFIDIDPGGMLETHVVNTNEILWYDNKGNKVNAIIFDTGKKELSDEDEKEFKAISEERLKQEKDKRYYRVIDSETDRIFVSDGGDISELPNSTYDNYFGFVPALILGDEKNPNEDIFESIISDVVEDADALLRLVSTSTVHDLAHLYPRYWSYAQACTRCEGEGQINTLVTEAEGETPAVYESSTCKSCGGAGHKARTNPSDETIVPVPMDGDPVLAPNLMGFVSPDLQTATFYATKIEKDRNVMFQAMWGTTYEQGGKRETATGRFLDAQPVQDRLRDMSSTFSNFHRFMLTCYGIVILRNPKYRPSVSYGMRYILEGSDDVLKKYTEATTYDISDVVYLDLRNQYLEAEYQNDPVELLKLQKLANVEPFPTMKISDVMSTEGLSEDDKLKKMYYSSWISQLEESKKILLNEEQLRDDLNKYVQTKQLKTETDEGI